ncbi:MAG: hypothetical protein ACPL7A_00705 [Anaerolineales bacterium]
MASHSTLRAKYCGGQGSSGERCRRYISRQRYVVKLDIPAFSGFAFSCLALYYRINRYS